MSRCRLLGREGDQFEMDMYLFHTSQAWRERYDDTYKRKWDARSIYSMNSLDL